MVQRFVVIILCVGMLAPFYAEARPSVDVPLSHWSYEAVEKLAIIGLCDIAEIGARPVSRIKMAYIIKTAIEKARDYNKEFDWNEQEYLETLLNQLIDEFRVELVDIGVEVVSTYEGAPKKTVLRPIDWINIEKAYGRLDSDSMLFENKEGWILRDGFNARVKANTWARMSDILAFSATPGLRYSKEDTDLDVENAHLRISPSDWNVECAIGRSSMQWGPGFHGSLLMTNNAFPQDNFRINNARPFRLPWFLRKIGRFSGIFFVSRLHQRGAVQDPWLSGWRMDYTPWGFLKFGFGHVLMFGGKGAKRINGSNFFAANSLVFSAAGGDSETEDHIISGDIQLFLRRIDRFIPIATGAKLYTEWGAEDEAGNRPVDLASILGVYITDILRIPGFDIKAEIANFHRVWYSHDTYVSGYSNRGNIIGHHAGGDSEDIAFSSILNSRSNFKTSATFSHQRRGLSRASVEVTNKIRLEFDLIDALDMYNIKDIEMTFFYEMEDIENFNNTNVNAKNQVLGAEVTRSF